jgi:hypothetical protein
MKLLLQLKHWQIFLISWAPLTGVLVILFTVPDLISAYFPIIFGAFLIGLSMSFAWIWTIVKQMKKLVPSVTITLFKIAFWIAFTYIWFIIGSLFFNFFIRKVQSFNIEIEMMLHGVFAILSICCIFYGLFFIGLLIKSAELGKKASFKEHLFASVAMLFPPIGLWIVQPKLNAIVRASF